MELHVFCFDYCVLEIERTASAGDFSLDRSIPAGGAVMEGQAHTGSLTYS